MTAPYDEDGEFSELVDGVFPRVDLVGKAANGVRFLIAKAAGNSKQGLVEAGIVRELISKARRDMSQLSAADLKRLAIDGTADERRAAHEEAGKRSLLGLEEPAPPPDTTPDLDLTPAPSGTVGMDDENRAIGQAVAKSVMAEQAVAAGTLTPAGAALVRLRANSDAARQIAALRARRQSGVIATRRGR